MTMTDQNFGFRFRDWDIYKDSRIFRVSVNKLLKTYPQEEKYTLVDQTKRALNSVILAIAEGANKNSDKETRVYINRAHTSLDEVVACLDCALDDGHLTKVEHQQALLEASSLAKRFRAFNSYLSGQQSIVNSHSFAKGFTLIELTVVIFIIALISGLSIANFRAGERRKQAGFASDGVINAIRNAQNLTLAGKSTNNSNSSCRVPQYYFVTFAYSASYSLSARNNCGTDDTIETYTLPLNTRVKASSLVLGGSTASTNLTIVFYPPFAVIKANLDGGTSAGFTTATVTVESVADATISRTVTVDGISGRVGE